MENDEPINFGGAAIVCGHVANSQFPILRATRDEPIEPADTGWQFTCNRVESEVPQEAQVWSLGEVIDLEPSLAPFMNCPVDTTIERKDKTSEWKVVEGGDCKSN